MDLYGLERSVYTRIARLALEEKGVAYTLHETEIFGPGGVPPTPGAASLRTHPGAGARGFPALRNRVHHALCR
jgi:hypothetical protein